MFRIVRSAKTLSSVSARRFAATSHKTPAPNALEADAGALATRVHHTMTLSLAVLTPVYFLIPDPQSGFFGKMFGVLLTANITAHSWIGLNYVCTDYVPKISRSLLGPSRVVVAGLCLVTMLGMSKIAVASPGGIKGCVKGVWNGTSKKKEGEFTY